MIFVEFLLRSPYKNQIEFFQASREYPKVWRFLFLISMRHLSKKTFFIVRLRSENNFLHFFLPQKNESVSYK